MLFGIAFAYTGANNSVTKLKHMKKNHEKIQKFYRFVDRGSFIDWAGNQFQRLL